MRSTTLRVSTETATASNSHMHSLTSHFQISAKKGFQIVIFEPRLIILDVVTWKKMIQEKLRSTSTCKNKHRKTYEYWLHTTTATVCKLKFRIKYIDKGNILHLSVLQDNITIIHHVLHQQTVCTNTQHLIVMPDWQNLKTLQLYKNKWKIQNNTYSKIQNNAKKDTQQSR